MFHRLLAEVTGRAVDEIAALHMGHQLLLPDEALALGFVDRVVPAP